MAVVILGGLVSSTVLTLLVTPALYGWLGAQREPTEDSMDESQHHTAS
jgi:Cu/Ag efflux pump CusA